MRKYLLLLPAIFFSALLWGQAGQINQINIVNFTVKNTLPASVDSWLSQPAALVLTAQKVPGTQVREPMMVLQIRSNSAIICGNTMATAKRVDPFDVRNFTTADLLGLLGNCHELKAGNYTICVQFFNIDKVAVSREVCKDFRVEDTNIDYAPPTLITPDNGKNIAWADLVKPIQFRWTPLVPKPKEPVTYRLKVWQLMQGQNGTAAMRSNTPIAEKEVKEITQATVTNLITGPCRPPYLCDFIWNVQALNREGKPLGRNNGMSEAWTFSADDAATLTPPKNIFPDNNKQLQPENAGNINFRWTPLVPKPSAPVTYRLKVWQLMQGQNGTTAMRSNQPIVTKDVDNITEANISSIYTGPCRPPYLCDFIWNVVVVTKDGTPGAASEPTTFSIGTTSTKGPVNSYPEHKKELTETEAKNTIVFRWTPLVPKPSTPVTYRLKVWQLMQGQNGTEAMRSNPPIVTKDVDNIMQANISGIYTGPCRPPYLCDFIWNVEVVTRDGTPGMASEPTTFTVAGANNKGPVNTFPEDKKGLAEADAKNTINFRWTPLVPKPSAPVTYRLKVWQLMQGQNGTTAMRSNQPIVTKDVDNITEANISGIYTGPCRPPYLCDFIWNVQVVTRDGTVGLSSDPTTFTIAAAKTKGPDNIYPEDKKELTPDQGKNPITFRWTPIVPKPQEPVTYRLKVWQLMQGQNGTTAMRSNPPIVTKEVNNITEAVVNGIYTGPCRPPYLCDFVWNVEATIRQAGAAPTIIGSSEPTAFSIAPQYIIQLDSIKVLCTSAPGVYAFSYTISNINAGTANLTNLAITSSVPAGATLGSFAPPIGTSIATGNQLTITGTINAAPNLSNICIGAEITDAANSFWKASRDTCIPVLPCKCDACDSVKIDVNPKGEITLDTAGSIIQNTTISVSPKPVKNIKAELVYFEYKPDSDDCMICNKDSKTYGNFIGASSGLVSPTIPYPHTVNWAPNGQMVTNQAFNFVISMPPTVKCCAATVKWCIRYVVTFMDCTVCSVVKCYEFNKKCECK